VSEHPAPLPYQLLSSFKYKLYRSDWFFRSTHSSGAGALPLIENTNFSSDLLNRGTFYIGSHVDDGLVVDMLLKLVKRKSFDSCRFEVALGILHCRLRAEGLVEGRGHCELYSPAQARHVLYVGLGHGQAVRGVTVTVEDLGR
jgi:hypothetical protein